MRNQTITKSLVDGLEARATEYSVWDAKLPGFGVRVRPTGSMSFIVVYRAGSGRSAPFRRYTIASVGKLAPEAARIRAKQILGKVVNGIDPANEKARERGTATVGELADLFVRHHADKKLKPSTCSYYRLLVETIIKPAFGSTKSDKLSRAAVSRLHSGMSKHRVNANRTLTLLSGIYAYGGQIGEVPEGYNPARGIEKFKEASRERFLNGDELGRLGAALQEAETVGIPWDVDNGPNSKHVPKLKRVTIVSKSAAAALRLLVLTGCRLREILHLKWEYVDFERGVLFLPDSKTGKKTVVLNAPALAVLAGLERIGPYVIPGDNIEKPRSDLKRPWAAVSTRAGLQGVRLHDLRHTYASFGVGGGLGLPIIGKLLGHAQASTTARYAHLDNDPLRRATEKIGAELSAAMGENIYDTAEVVPMRSSDFVPRQSSG
ncbi:integrase [Nitrobacter vulgaris]|uniref:integrase n=1 Tax=Nitrobacter vulgaris TaxID=29421 RepID=UPI00285B7BD5|nr:site-specific integrase [Nitrobacter vulgaris]MDR6303983.1 integrase [Nitrobacter vulgaris]